MGLTEHDLDDETISILPDNVLAYEFFTRIMYQWRIGMNGPVSLDYNVFPFVFKMLRVKKKSEQYNLFECSRILERVALESFREDEQ